MIALLWFVLAILASPCRWSATMTFAAGLHHQYVGM